MFQVKGWAVSAPLAQQTEPVAVPDTTSINPGDETQKSRKRKRSKKDGHSQAPSTNGNGAERQTPEKKQKKDVVHGANRSDQPKSANKSNKQRQQEQYQNGHREEREGRKPGNAHPAKPKQEPATNPKGKTPSWISNDKHLTSMQRAMRDKLIGARFRHLNETMYTSSNAANLKLFSQHPDMWRDYHAGFSQQVQSWPENPIDHFIAECRSRAALRGPQKGQPNGHRMIKPLPRCRNPIRTIIDMGCGDAKFGRAFEQKERKTLKLRIRSFDLQKTDAEVEVADCGAGLPDVDSESAVVVVICLALMGTDWVGMIDEAWRVLERGGELWIAEIKSRFVRGDKRVGPVEHSVGNKKKKRKPSEKDKMAVEQQQMEDDETLAREVDGAASVNDTYRDEQTDVSAFVGVLEAHGFSVDGAPGSSAIDLSNKMFVKFRFVKSGRPTRGRNAVVGGVRMKGKLFLEAEGDGTGEDDNGVLKPCLYKIR
jgi:ribosomal RNA-processing protein 8